MRAKKKASRVSIESPLISKRLLASFINIAALVGLTYIAYYGIARPSFINRDDYSSATTIVKDANERYDFSIKINQTPYTVYSKPVDSFYFDDFPRELESFYKTNYDYDWSIYKIYAVEVCRLPESPSPSDYSTDYFSYALNSDGSVNTEAKPIINASLNKTGLSDLRDIYWNAYETLPTFYGAIVPEYSEALSTIKSIEGIARLYSFAFSVGIIYLLLPLFLRNNSTIGEKIFKIGYSNVRGYQISPLQIILKACLVYALPSVALFYQNMYTIMFLMVAPAFLNLLITLLSSNHVGLLDAVSFERAVDLQESHIYKNQDQEEDVLSTSIPVYEQKDYTSKLGEEESMQTPNDLLDTKSTVDPKIHKGDNK